MAKRTEKQRDFMVQNIDTIQLKLILKREKDYTWNVEPSDLSTPPLFGSEN